MAQLWGRKNKANSSLSRSAALRAGSECSRMEPICRPLAGNTKHEYRNPKPERLKIVKADLKKQSQFGEWVNGCKRLCYTGLCKQTASESQEEQSQFLWIPAFTGMTVWKGNA